MGYIFLNDTIRQIENDYYKNSKNQDVLMQTAGLCVFNETVKVADAQSKIVVLCGSGNNGGDGFVAARLLHNNGYNVSVCEVLDAKSELCKAQKELYKGDIIGFDNGALAGADILVDAILGTGFKGEADEYLKNVFNCFNNSSAYKIAVDIPSGLNADDNNAACCIKADTTLTFIGYKKCFLGFPSAEACGRVVLNELGLNEDFLCNYKNEGSVTDRPQIKRRQKNTHKGTYKNAVLVCGSYGFAGAAILAARALLKSGIGIARLVLPNDIYNAVTSAVPEAVCLPVDEFESKAQAEIEKADCVAVGCGLSLNEQAKRLLKLSIKYSSKTLIVDADGLNILSTCIDLIKGVNAKLVLTPHPGEMSRLCNVSVSEIENNRVYYALDLAKRLNAVVVLKGAVTVIADANGAVRYNLTGNAGMATGGSGDALAGIAAALCAQSADTFDAVCNAVYIHGLAGDLVKEKLGEISMLPSDLIENLPDAFKLCGE